MTLLAWSPAVFAVLTTAVCLGCLALGAWEERVLGCLYGMACFASLAAASRLWREPQWAVGAIDLIYFCAVVVVVWRSRKFWPIWIGAMQILTLTTHVAYWLSQGRFGADAYLTVLGLWSYGIVFCLGLAAFLACRAARRRRDHLRIDQEARRLLAQSSDLQAAWRMASDAAERHVAEHAAHEFYLAVARRVTELGAG